MKKLLLLLPFILVACSDSSEKTPYNNYDSIPVINYNADGEDLYLYSPSSLSNAVNITLASGISSSVEVRFSSRNKTSEVFKIVSTQVQNLPQSCVKKYEVNEECSFMVPLSASIKGYVVLRVPTSLGLKIIYFKINRTQGTSEAFTLDETSQSVGAIHYKSSVRKVIGLKNQGAGLLTVTASVTGRDQVSVIKTNSCVNVSPQKKCYVSYEVRGSNKNDGIYEDSITLTSGQTTAVMRVENIQIFQSQSVNKVPVWVTNSLATSAGEVKNIQLQATDEDGDALRYSIVSQSNLLISNFNENAGSFTLQGMSIGSYDLTVLVTDGKSPAVSKSFSVRVFPQMVLNDKNFIEGENQDPLFTLSLAAAPLTVTSVTSDLSNVFSVLKVTGTGSSYSSTSEALIGNVLPVVSGSSSLALNFVGAVKIAGTYTVSYVVTFSDASSYDYKHSIQVESSHLPIVKYDITLARIDSHSASLKNTMKNNLFNYIKEISRTYGGWRTPILMRFKHESIVCNGVALENFEDTTDQQSCLRSKVSADAESVFSFRRTYSGGDEIGGIAQGLRSGTIVSASAGRQTVISHELGHNFGLWHSFESYFNTSIIQCDQANNVDCYYRNLYVNTYSGNGSIVGDFSDYIIKPNSSDPFVVSYDFTVNDDTVTDFYGARRALYNPACYGSFCYTERNYAKNNVIFLIYGQDASSVCQQSFGSSPYAYPVYCTFNHSPMPDRYLEESIVKNVMSYWDKPSSTSIFSSGQRARMDNQIGRYPILSTP